MDRVTLAERIEQEIRSRITAGIYMPGSYLPAERRLATEFGTTRTTLGVALNALEQDGLVLRSAGRGTRVLHPADRLGQRLIGLVQGPMTTAPVAWSQGSLATLHGVQDTLKRLHYPYELVVIRRDEALRTQVLSRFGAALFVEATELWNPALQELVERRVPVVVAKLESNMDVACTYVDHKEPRLISVRNLVNLGHRRIAFLGREPGYVFYGQARQGYEEGLREAGIPLDESLIAVCEQTDALSGYFAAKSLLQLNAPPTAILAARDTLAEGACRAVEERGMRVGFDVSVIGFDHMTWPGGEEFLTTFHEPCYEMGSAAAEMLVARIVNRLLPKEKRKFDTPFILRRSAGPAPVKGSTTKTGDAVHRAAYSSEASA